ncbi:MAG: S9 family peptidase [Proteobacteria bacterium]|nr:S9 family peptidase [Pseudomonadota bacterium]
MTIATCSKCKVYIIIAMLLSVWSVLANAQSTDQSYRLPPLDIADIVDAAPTPGVLVDPRNNWILLMSRPGLPTIAELSEPELRIAGMRINPANNAASRRTYFNGLTLRHLGDASERRIVGLPNSPRIDSVTWSPDGEHLAFVLDRGSQVELWVADIDSGQARKLLDTPVNSIFGQPYSWLSDSESLVVKTIPRDRGLAPVMPLVPTGPIIQESSGRPAAARTYQDLLINSHDEDLFDYYAAVQLLLVSLDGSSTALNDPGLIRRAIPSPDGEYILVEVIHRPFSYLVPNSRFPRRLEVWDAQGNLSWQLADLPLAEEVPIGRDAVPTGPRSANWRTDTGATVYWVEARDGGNPRIEAEVRDVVLSMEAPFTTQPKEIISLQLRYAGATWGNGELALISENWRSNRQIRTWMVAPDATSPGKTLLFDRSSEDRYNDPGTPVMVANAYGRFNMLISDDNRAIYLRGQGASDEGDRPFLDKFELSSKSSQRLWQSEAPTYATFIAFLDDDQQSVLIRRESPTTPGNYFRLQLADPDNAQALTSFPHPYPQMANVYKEVLRYQRDDGVMLTATLYLPPGMTPDDGPFPMLMWAYPREYKDAASAGQMRGSPYRFNAISVNGPLPFLASGYAVLDGPTMPIVGEGDLEPNDVFVEQLVSSAAAAVDAVVLRGVAERNKIAVGGHSYGAFMTANLLAHSDLFVAGLARSGAYNRTLTPFGFQSEERTYWEAPEVYFNMSPFMHAQMINEPLLLIHGEADNNSGTFPLQSRRFYNALKGHGVKTRLVMLPHESHGYRARESVMHTLWEMNTWLNRYLKGE